MDDTLAFELKKAQEKFELLNMVDKMSDDQLRSFAKDIINLHYNYVDTINKVLKGNTNQLLANSQNFEGVG